MSNSKAHQQIKFELKIDGIGGAILKIEFKPSFFFCKLSCDTKLNTHHAHVNTTITTSTSVNLFIKACKKGVSKIIKIALEVVDNGVFFLPPTLQLGTSLRID